MQQEQYKVHYKVHLESFEGPLDLLLHLIEKNRIDIYDIPIALLTEQYMDYLAKFKEFNIEVASEFLVMAATLLQIKSKILLPDTKVEEVNEDDTDEVDPRKELVERLLEYRRYKEVSSILGEMADEAGKRFFREASNLPTKHLPPKGLDVKLLWQAFQNVLESQIENEPLVANVAREKYTIEDKIISLLALLKQHGGNICFNIVFQYSEHKISKSELITTFLAMLELIKIKRITVYQTSIFSPIYLKINDEVVGGIYSIWTLIDIEKRRIVRPQKVGITIPECEEYSSFVDKYEPLLDIETQKVQTREVMYSDIDLNKHMNNARYLEWVMDLLPQNVLEKYFIGEMTMHYQKEIAPESIVDLYYGQEDDHFKIEFKIAEQIHFVISGRFKEKKE